MTTRKKTIDEIWKELNSAPKSRSNLPLRGIESMPGITTQVRIVSKNQQPALIDTDMQEVLLQSQPGRSLNLYDASKAGVTDEEVNHFIGSCQRTINCLADPSRTKRRDAAHTLQCRLLSTSANADKPSPPLLQALICGPLLIPLSKLLSDPAEQCRQSAIQILTEAAGVIMDVEPMLSTLIPEIVRRMGPLPVVEQAEEIRLSLVNLLSALITKAPTKGLEPYAAEFALFLCRSLEDSFHEVRKSGCTCLAKLCTVLPATTLEAHAEKLLVCLVATLSHPHSRIRLAAIQSLDELVASGAVPSTLLSSVVAPGIRPSASDRSPQVRTAVFTAVARWLGASEPASPSKSPAQAYEHLLPILLLGLSDPVESTARDSLNLVEHVAIAWFANQPKSESHTKEMEVDEGAQPSRQTATPSEEASAMEVQHTSSHAEVPESTAGVAVADSAAVTAVESAAAVTAASSALSGSEECGNRVPEAFDHAPCSEARTMVSSLLPEMLRPVLKDLSDWTVGARTNASRILTVSLAISGQGATPLLDRLIPSLCSAVGDEDAAVASSVVRAVHALGANTLPRYWLPLTLEHLSLSRLTAAVRASTLVVLSGLIYSASHASVSPPSDDLIIALADALVGDDLRGSDHAGIKAQLLAVAVNLMGWIGPQVKLVSSQMCVLLLQLAAGAGSAAVVGAMSQLAVGCGVSSFEDVVEQHADNILSDACLVSSTWVSESPSYALLRSLLLTCAPSTLARLLNAALPHLSAAVSDHDQDPALRMSVLRLMDETLESTPRCAAVPSTTAFALLVSVLLPPMVWRAGKTAAAVRFTAITALNTLLASRKLTSADLHTAVTGYSLLPLLHSALEEDWYADIRRTACSVMAHVLRTYGPDMTAEERRLVYPELLKRLDDSDNQIRIAVCDTLVAFAETLDRSYCPTNSGYLAAGIVIHMDDSDPAVQEAAARAMEALARVKPEEVGNEVRKVRDRFRSKHYCERILAAAAAAAVPMSS